GNNKEKAIVIHDIQEEMPLAILNTYTTRTDTGHNNKEQQMVIPTSNDEDNK
ncbi:hypothetical protein HAX54_001017, partial [Datura stramonium]|nr:hypothetical protein [Datura stramonium]